MMVANLLAVVLQTIAPPGGPEPVVSPVVIPARWLQPPRMLYPAEARRRGRLPGRVQLSCIVKTDGLVRDCRIASEEPAGHGFGEAALSGVRTARFTPRTVDDVATEQEITIPMSFHFQ